MIFLDELLAVLHDLIDSLNYGVRRQPSVFDGEVHGPAGEVHPDAELLRGCRLGTDEISGIFRKYIVMVENSGAAVLNELTHGHLR